MKECEFAHTKTKGERASCMKKAVIGLLLPLLVMLLGGSSSAIMEANDTEQFIQHSGLEATIIVSSLKTGEEHVINKERSEQRFLPASTFKIPNTLIALHEGVINDENTVLPWDGKEKGLAAWNKDQTLTSAFQVSCIWYYQELARKIGLVKYAEHLGKLVYGNCQTGAFIDTFWLDGDLRISAREQIDFLKNIYLETYDFDKAHYNILKDIMVEDTTDAYTLRGKTGWTQRVSPQTGWYVGYVETASDVWFFACNLTITKPSDADCRKSLVMSYLRELKIME